MIRKQIFEWVNLVLGLWLIISPWALGFSASVGALWSTLLLGLGVAVVAIWGLAKLGQQVPDWVNLVLGIALFLAPWVIGFSMMAGAAWNSWLLGIAVFVIAGLPLIPGVPDVRMQH